LLVKDNVAVEEEVLEQTYEGRPYEYPLVRVFEIGDDGKIRRLRMYFDRLSIEQQVHTVCETAVRGRAARLAAVPTGHRETSLHRSTTTCRVRVCP
jgi:hypothetical protein